MVEIDISSSQEDYLEAIAQILKSNEHAHTKDIAARLQVSYPSVTGALKGLATRGLIRYEKHMPVTLTMRGARLANQICHRHEVMREFFSGILKLDEKNADQSACKVEHILDDTFLNRFEVLANAILSRDDCAGLRQYLEKEMPKIVVQDDDLISLDKLPVGQNSKIITISENMPGKKKFADMGLVNGMEVAMESHSPFGDLLRIRLMGSSISIRETEACHIWVRPVQGPENKK